MKKILAVVLALVLCMALCAVGSAADKYKVGILAPAVTHGWVAGVAYNAEQECLALADEVDYKLYTSNNAEEMTTQLDDLMTWGAQKLSLHSRSGKAWKCRFRTRLMPVSRS